MSYMEDQFDTTETFFTNPSGYEPDYTVDNPASEYTAPPADDWGWLGDVFGAISKIGNAVVDTLGQMFTQTDQVDPAQATGQVPGQAPGQSAQQGGQTKSNMSFWSDVIAKSAGGVLTYLDTQQKEAGLDKRAVQTNQYLIDAEQRAINAKIKEEERLKAKRTKGYQPVGGGTLTKPAAGLINTPTGTLGNMTYPSYISDAALTLR